MRIAVTGNMGSGKSSFARLLAGAGGEAATIVDADSPLGRVDVALLGDDSVVVLWVSRAGADEMAEVRARRYAPNGGPGAPLVVARISASRGAGFPRMAAFGDRVLVAWTDAGRSGIGTALLELGR